MLAKQKLEYTDFSAGISENIVPGKQNSYARADNLLITRDKHLETRPGSRALSDTLFYLPSGTQRVGGLYNFYNDTSLFVQSGIDLFYASTGPSPVWTTLLGPTGGHAFTGNSTDSRVFSAQWRQQMFFVSDSGQNPQFLFYDQHSAPQIRSAGLPRPAFSAVYTDDQYLQAGLALAQALVASMISHYGDGGGAGHAHVTAHAAAVTALSALTAPLTLSDLISYIGTIKTYYNLHIADAQLDVATGQVFHINKQRVATIGTYIPFAPSTSFFGRYSVLNVLANTGLAAMADATSTVAVLNDLRNRYNMHTYATLTHANAVTSVSTQGSYANDTSGYGKYSCVLSPVTQNSVTVDGVTVFSPTVTGGLSVLFAYINQIKAEMNAHFGNGIYHSSPDTDNAIVAPDATDMLSATILLCHFEFFFWWHYADAGIREDGNYPFSNQVGWTGGAVTAIDGSATLTGNFISTNFFQGQTLVNRVATAPFSAPWVPGKICAASRVTVVSNTSTTALLSSPVTSASSAAAAGLVAGTYGIINLSNMLYHYGQDTFTVAPTTTPAQYLQRVLAYDYTLQDTAGLVLNAQIFFALFQTHELAQWTVSTASGQPAYFINNTQSLILYGVHNAPAIGGATWPEAPVPDVTLPGQFLTPTKGAAYFLSPPLPGTVLYTVVWRYDYQSVGLTFENDSTPALLASVPWVQMPSGPLPLQTSPYPVVLTGLPTLTNLPGQNWDTANIKLDIYRTITNGGSLFLAGTVSNGTTTFTDTVTDVQLITNEPIYTTGGVLQNDQPPASRFITIMNDTAYYGYVTDITSGEVFPNRILQSIPVAPYAAPAENFDDLDDQLTGLSNYNNYVLAFCKSKIYRMEGVYDELGNGLLSHQNISPTIGGISHASLVQTEYGIFFCGTNGIYWTDGFTLTRLTAELEKTYNALIQSPTQRARINSVYDKTTRRIYWSFCSNPTQPECDVTYILDLNWGISERSSFTTMSGPYLSPSALTLFNGQIVRGTSYGMIFKHDPSLTSDFTPILDQFPSTHVPSTDWAPQPILYDFQSCQTNFGTSQIRKWATRVTYQGQAQSNLFLQINRKNDNGGPWQPLVPVRSIAQCVWGDPAVKWGQAGTLWGADGMIDTFRRMPAGSLRCDWMAVQFTNASSIIAASDTFGVVSTGALSAGSVVLTLPTPYQWPLWAKLYTLSFQNDGYIKQYAITARTAQTLTIADPGATAPASQTGVLWQIEGIPYGQRFCLTAYNITYAPLSDEQAAYHGPTSTDGGANTT